MNKEELFALADYIAETYPFVEIRFIEWVVAEKVYALEVEFPNGDSETIYSRNEWDVYHEPEAAAWKEWTGRRTGKRSGVGRS